MARVIRVGSWSMVMGASVAVLRVAGPQALPREHRPSLHSEPPPKDPVFYVCNATFMDIH
jgi:hypothetical protein